MWGHLKAVKEDVDHSAERRSAVALRAGAWYIFSSVMVKSISVLTMPIFTRMMTTEEYGIVSTFTTWYSLLSVFCTLNLTYSIGRAKQDFPGKLEYYIGSMQMLAAMATLCIVAVILLFIEPAAEVMELSMPGVILLLVYLLFSPAISFFQNGFRYRYCYKENVAIAWYVTVSSVTLSLLLIAAVDYDRAILRMIGIVFPVASLSIAFWIFSIRKGVVKPDREFWLYGMKLSLPLVLHTVSLNILAQSDRIFIVKLCGASDAGVYSLVYSYGVLISIITNAIAEGWLPWFHDSYFAQEFDAISKNVKPIVILGCYLALGCIALAPELVLLLGGERYMAGIKCVPPVVLGVLCQYVYTHYVNIELHLKKTKFVSMGTIFAAGLNMILNALFIPVFGFVAAAYTTLLSYICLLFIHCFITKKILKVKLYDDVFMFAAIGVTAFVSAGVALTYDHIVIRYLATATGFVGFLFTFRGYTAEFAEKFRKKCSMGK